MWQFNLEKGKQQSVTLLKILDKLSEMTQKNENDTIKAEDAHQAHDAIQLSEASKKIAQENADFKNIQSPSKVQKAHMKQLIAEYKLTLSNSKILQDQFKLAMDCVEQNTLPLKNILCELNNHLIDYKQTFDELEAEVTEETMPQLLLALFDDTCPINGQTSLNNLKKMFLEDIEPTEC